ncbi:MAG: DUF6635 family protein [Rhizomicrobium sp.]|jgi:hypothetical protein
MAGQSTLRPPAINRELARSIVESAIRIYFRKRRSRVPRFVDETYSVRGALKLHRHAIGHDLWRAPFNALMAGPQLGLSAAAYAFERAGRTRDAQWLKSRELFVRTTVAHEIERRIVVDLLELPYSGPGATSFNDALAIEIMGDQRLRDALSVLEGPWGEDERSRIEALLAENLSIYLNGRAAVNEITSGTLTLGAGALLLHELTPGILALGPAIARAVAAKTAGTAGALAAGGSVLLATAMASAFSGVITDPIQKALGIHHRRLIDLLDTLENGFLGGDARLAVQEHYAARLVDIFSAVAAVWSYVMA